MKVTLKCISPHLPNGIVEVNEEKVDELIKTGAYKRITVDSNIREKEKKQLKEKEYKNKIIKEDDTTISIRNKE